MTAMIAAASQQNIILNPTKKIDHRREKKSSQSNTPQTTRSDQSLKERYEKFIQMKCLIDKVDIPNLE
jgi:hypothetical protein